MEPDELSTLLGFFYSDGADVPGKGADSTARRERNNKFPAVKFEELKNLLRSPKGSFPEGKSIHIKNRSKDPTTVSALTLYWDFTEGVEEFRCYLGFWSDVDLAPLIGGEEPRQHVVFSGFRIETPESKGDDHNYFHAQPCRSMSFDEKVLKNALPISHRTPTFPITASNPLEMVAAIILSLHGSETLKGFKSDLSGRVEVRSKMPAVTESIDAVLNCCPAAG